jgi:hypothetical protein
MAYNSNFDVLESAKIILFCIVILILLFFAQIICILGNGENSDVVKDLQNLQKGDILSLFKATFGLLTFSIIPFPFNLVPILFSIILGLVIVAFVINELLALIPSWL